MYGLPENIDLKFFEQQELLQICVGKNEVILNFTGHISVTIQSRFACSNSKPLSIANDELPLAAYPLLYFIGALVVKAEGDTDGTLRLTFSNTELLLVHDDDPNYESYVITRNGQTVIIV